MSVQDDILTVIRRVDENWAEGMLGDKIGIFPISYVEVSNIPLVMDTFTWFPRISSEMIFSCTKPEPDLASFSYVNKPHVLPCLHHS